MECGGDRWRGLGGKIHVNSATPWMWHSAGAPATRPWFWLRPNWGAAHAANGDVTHFPGLTRPEPVAVATTHTHTHHCSAQRARGRRRKKVFSQSNGLNLFIHYYDCQGDKWSVSVTVSLAFAVYTAKANALFLLRLLFLPHSKHEYCTI